MAIGSIAFRTDASNRIGEGHFMRCLTLASELKSQGARIHFISRHLPKHLRKMLAAKNIEFSILSSKIAKVPIDELTHSSWLGVSQDEDAQETIQALGDHLWDWIIVDHYALDARWEDMVRTSAKKIMSIDDIADRQHNCDILLDQNYYADMQERYSGKVPNYCQLLLGPNYSLLREEFKILHGYCKPHTGEIKRILVFFGGVDIANFTSLAIDVLTALKIEMHVDVVIGAQHPCLEEIQKTCLMCGYDLHIQAAYIADLMSKADLAIGAAGSASWERCCLGLPTLLVAAAENQIEIAKGLDSFGACIYIGEKDSVNVLTMQEAAMKLLNEAGKVRAISKKAFSLVDGLGVQRVSQKLSC